MAQVALAVVLVTAASLMAVTLRNLRRVNGGFAVDGVLMASLETRGTTYEAGGTSPLNDEVLAAVRAAPGVRSAVTAIMLPMFGGTIGWLAIDVPGYTPARGEEPLARQVEVSPDYFRALGIPLQAGREFTTEDSPGGARTAIVSAAFARRYFKNADPVGRSFRVRLTGDSMTTLRVVGVASDAKYMSPRDRPEAVVYLPFAQTVDNWSALQVAIRTDGDPMAVAPALLRAIDAAAPGIRVRRVSDMRARLDVAVSLYQLSAQLASFAGAMVLALCAVGLYGVVAYGVARRTSELGLRVSAHDPPVMVFAMVTFSLVALIACAVPARRAVRIDPAIALAAE